MAGEHVASSKSDVVTTTDVPTPTSTAGVWPTEIKHIEGELVKEFIPKTPAEAAKAIGHIALVAVSAIIAANQGGGVTLTAGVSIAIMIVGLIPVYLFSGTYAKMVAAGAVAFLQAIATVAINWQDLAHISGTDWTLVLIAVLNAVGVGVIPNAPWSGSANKA